MHCTMLYPLHYGTEKPSTTHKTPDVGLLTIADTGSRIGPPNATLDAIALPFIRVLCCLMFNLVSPISPHGCSSRYFQSVKIQSGWVQWDYFFPGVGFGNSLCWTLRGSCQPTSAACQSASEWQQTHILHQALLPDFFCVLPLLRLHFVPLARFLMKTLNSSDLSQALWLVDDNSLQETLHCWSHSCELSSWATFQSPVI